MQGYVCGFLFSPDRARVLLIRKNRPAWQAGKLNGVGGKIEPGESRDDAMRREFREEAGVDIATFQHVLTLTGVDWQGHFYRAFGPVDDTRPMTDERLEIHPTRPLPRDTIPNLQWMTPLLLDDDVVASEYTLSVVAPRTPPRGG